MKNSVLQQLLPFEFASPAVVVAIVLVVVADVVNKLVVVADIVAVALV